MPAGFPSGARCFQGKRPLPPQKTVGLLGGKAACLDRWGPITGEGAGEGLSLLATPARLEIPVCPPPGKTPCSALAKATHPRGSSESSPSTSGLSVLPHPGHREQKGEAGRAPGDSRGRGQARARDPRLPEGKEGAAYPARGSGGPRAGPGAAAAEAAGAAGTGAKDSSLQSERG